MDVEFQWEEIKRISEWGVLTLQVEIISISNPHFIPILNLESKFIHAFNQHFYSSPHFPENNLVYSELEQKFVTANDPFNAN